MKKKRTFILLFILAVVVLLINQCLLNELSIVRYVTKPHFLYNWQIQKTSGGTFQLLSGYLDDRRLERGRYLSKIDYTVRIIGMFDQIHAKNAYCQIWYDNGEVETSTASLTWIWRDDWDVIEFYQPYIISCHSSKVPRFVSVVENRYDRASNKFEIQYKKREVPKKDFVVCVKGLNFLDDLSTRLIEWLELLSLLGASRVHFYTFHVHPNIAKTLDYYKHLGLVDVTRLTLVGNEDNTSGFVSKFLKEEKVKRRLQEVLPFNDCFYRYYQDYKYVVALDTDEVIVPKKGTWSTLMKDLHARNFHADTYMARNVYFFDKYETNVSEVPGYMYIMRHITRAKDHLVPGQSVKSFHDTETVKALYNHEAMWCDRWFGCVNRNIDVDLAQLQHYREGCVAEVNNCDELMNNTVTDSRVWRFKDELVKRVEDVMNDLNFL